MDVAHSPDSTVVVLAGIAFAYSITVLQPLNLEPTSINILLAGSIAICAMILPGISGSFEQVMIYKEACSIPPEIVVDSTGC